MNSTRTTIKKLMRQFTRRELIDLINEVHDYQETHPVDDAIKFLKGTLARPRQVKHVRKEASELGISKSTLYRAAIHLRLKKKSTGFGKQKRSWWSLR